MPPGPAGTGGAMILSLCGYRPITFRINVRIKIKTGTKITTNRIYFTVASLTVGGKYFIVGVRRLGPPHPWPLPVQQFEDCCCDQAGDCTSENVGCQAFHSAGRRRLSPAAFFLAHFHHPLSVSYYNILIAVYQYADCTKNRR